MYSHIPNNRAISDHFLTGTGRRQSDDRPYQKSGTFNWVCKKCRSEKIVESGSLAQTQKVEECSVDRFLPLLTVVWNTSIIFTAHIAGCSGIKTVPPRLGLTS